MDIYRHFTGGPQRAKDNVGAWMVFRLGGTEDAFLDQLRHQRVILCQLPNLRSSDEVRATVSDMGDERLVISDDEHRQGRAHAWLTDVALTLAIDNRVRRLHAKVECARKHLWTRVIVVNIPNRLCRQATRHVPSHMPANPASSDQAH